MPSSSTARHRPAPPFVLLDFAAPGSARSTQLFQHPHRVIRADEAADVVDALDRVEQATQRGAHAVGFLSYEAAPAFDRAAIVHARGALPLLWFGIFDAPEPIDLDASADAPAVGAWESDATRETHRDAVESVRRSIERGDVYQVNYTTRLRAPITGDPLALYRQLRDAQQSGYSAYIDLGDHCICSASPELFFRRTGREIVTRPMKGTAARGRWPEEDDERAAALAASEKDRAENVMIVDLVRNDLGRIAEPGSVRVPELFSVERYPTVLQMTSTIEATLVAGTSLGDIVAALFPCGSVTGAPKLAAMQTIAALEPSPRGIYCGTIGHIDQSGDATFNVAIRTVHVDREAMRAEYGVGGAVTWDSTAEDEYDELRKKAAILTAAAPEFELLETMRLDHGEYARRERHVNRMEASAGYFGMRFSRVGVEAALDAYARTMRDDPHRVRLLLSRLGHVRVEGRPLEDDAAEIVRPVALAATPVSSSDPFLFHKTTHRTVYERHRRAHPVASDVLLWNEAGELTEFTIGNLVVELDGARWTPRRSSGLLAGTFRAQLIEEGAVRERVLRAADLERATGIWLINSVRSWVRVVFGTLPLGDAVSSVG